LIHAAWQEGSRREHWGEDGLKPVRPRLGARVERYSPRVWPWPAQRSARSPHSRAIAALLADGVAVDLAQDAGATSTSHSRAMEASIQAAPAHRSPVMGIRCIARARGSIPLGSRMLARPVCQGGRQRRSRSLPPPPGNRSMAVGMCCRRKLCKVQRREQGAARRFSRAAAWKVRSASGPRVHESWPVVALPPDPGWR